MDEGPDSPCTRNGARARDSEQVQAGGAVRVAVKDMLTSVAAVEHVVTDIADGSTHGAGHADRLRDSLTLAGKVECPEWHIGEAFRQVRDGEAQIALAGGADSMLNPLGLGGFSLLRVLSAENEHPTTACRPFDATREGTVLGEGAAFLVLEKRRVTT